MSPKPVNSNQFSVPAKRPVTTEEQLALLGWKPGDPIPSDMSGMMLGLKKQLISILEVSTDPADAKKLKEITKPGYIFNVADTLPEQRASLAEFIRFNTEQVREQEYYAKAESLIPPVITGVDRDTWRNSIINSLKAGGTGTDAAPKLSAEELAARTETTLSENMAKLKDRLSKLPEGAAPEWVRKMAESPALYGGGIEVKPEDLKNEDSEVPRVIDDREVPQINGTQGPAIICPCCNWDTSKPFDLEITAEDKRAYLAAWLGKKRFRKTFSLFNGMASVTFRTLTSEEIQLLYEELSVRTKAGIIVGDAQFAGHWLDNRLVLSTESIVADGLDVYRGLELKDLITDQDSRLVAVKQMAERFYKEVSQESMRKVLGVKHRLFDHMVETLDVNVDNENFYAGIE